MAYSYIQFSIPQIEYPLGCSSKTGSHVYFLLIFAMVLLLWRLIVLLWHQVTMVASEQHLYQTIILPRKPITGSIHDYLLCYCPLVGILFVVLRILSLQIVNKEYCPMFSKLSLTVQAHVCSNLLWADSKRVMMIWRGRSLYHNLPWVDNKADREFIGEGLCEALSKKHNIIM